MRAWRRPASGELSSPPSSRHCEALVRGVAPVRRHPGLRQHLRAQNLAGGVDAHHPLQRRAGPCRDGRDLSAVESPSPCSVSRAPPRSRRDPGGGCCISLRSATASSRRASLSGSRPTNPPRFRSPSSRRATSMRRRPRKWPRWRGARSPPGHAPVGVAGDRPSRKSVDCVGRLAREILSLSDPRVTNYVHPMSAWYDAKTGRYVVDLGTACAAPARAASRLTNVVAPRHP